MEISSNHCVVASQCLRLCKQNWHPSNHCVGVQVCDTQIMPYFRKSFSTSNSITGGGGRWIGVLNGGGSPETKLWPFVAPLCTQITPNRVISLLTSCMWSPNSLHTIPTKPWPLNGTNRPLVGQEKAETKSRPAILQGNTECRWKYIGPAVHFW